MRLRLLTIAICALLIIGVAWAAVAWLRQPDGGSLPAENPTLPVVQPSGAGGGVTFTTSRGTVRTRDFFATAIASTTYEVTLLDDPESGAIYFDPVTRSFNVLVAAPDLAAFRLARTQLEQKLLELLGISPDDACTLNVFLNARTPGVPALDSAQLGLSFCPGAIPTP